MFGGLYWIIFIINIRTSSCAIEALYETGQRVRKLYAIIDNKGLDITHHAEATDNLSDNSIIREMKKQVDEIHESLNQLDKFMGSKQIRDAIKSWPLGPLTIRNIDTMDLLIQSIDEYYAKFNQYRNESHCSHASSEVLMEDIFPTLEGDIRIIRNFVTNEDKSSWNKADLVATIASSAATHRAEICGAPQILSSILMQLFKMIIIAELKTSTMLAYDNIYGYVKNKDKGGWQTMNSLARENLEKRFAIYANMFSVHIAVIDGVYNRACNPPDGRWIRGKSFYELETTFQPIMFGYNFAKCRADTCNNIINRKVSQCDLTYYGELIGNNVKYTVGECCPLGHIKACILKQNSSHYRFYYVNSDLLGFLGRNDRCPEDDGQLVDSCIIPTDPYLACVCHSSSSHNKINLLMMGSDVESNRVITGLRFLRKNEVLYIQPREGILGPNGYINRYSQRWIPIPENINSSLLAPINRDNGVFFLDDLTLPTSFVLTGVKFNKVTRRRVSGFAISIFGTYFDYTNGKLLPVKDFRASRQSSNDQSGKSLSFKAVSSIYTRLPHKVTLSDAKYVSLEPSELKEDFGQSTLPLIDALPILMDIPTALGGVGIFHKGVEGYAGLISLRVYGIQYEEYFKDFKLYHITNDRVSFNSSSHLA